MAYYLMPGYRVRRIREPDMDHWQGGNVNHKGAWCAKCRRPFQLIWEFDCAAPEFHFGEKPVFRDLERIALYYCCTCLSEIDYQIAAPNRLKLLKQKGGESASGFPYDRFPLAFQRMPIALERLDQLPEQIKKAASCDLSHTFTASQRKLLSRWLGRPVSIGLDLWLHQLGGIPWLIQGPERILCPNKACGWSRRHRFMKILAVVHNDPLEGLPLVENKKQVEKHGANHWVQVVFHICKGCMTIHAANRCD